LCAHRTVTRKFSIERLYVSAGGGLTLKLTKGEAWSFAVRTEFRALKSTTELMTYRNILESSVATCYGKVLDFMIRKH